MENTSSLEGKTVAVTGSTGGIGRELCRYLAGLSASLILVDRNRERSLRHRQELTEEYGNINIKCITADLEDFASVKRAVSELKQEPVDVFIHNAGAYSIPRHKCGTGFDNVFQINFVSPYYMIRELLPSLQGRGGRVVAVGSIAHNYSKTDADDIDFSKRRRASRVYGNAKRYLMFSLYELFRDEEKAGLSVVHPGITLTNITAHYPKPVFAVIKHPMKLIFMKPDRACLSVLRGVFESCSFFEWIGPSVFSVWGMPKKRRLTTCTEKESLRIGQTAVHIYKALFVNSNSGKNSENKQKITGFAENSAN